ncbi:DUF3127 domain-containing protein [Prevotella sp. PCHR]|uniref:DUF3127 domain-containing protein n=1 Tax=Xylanibacter caecicola TaxID=2736294 RepID=A0ABX2B6N4_9BACT|nr:DUF3127 domain-containing protein [Xylanibacter caecicola]NPE25759.1 DUF3127 domain-containing protein [Xylanibacter caecicola]
MEIEGKIIMVLPEQSGVSARTGNAWKSQEFVIETHEQYPRKCCFRVFGADRLATMNIQSGEELRVSVDIDAREYNGRWFNSINAWKVERIDPMAAQAAAQAPQPSATEAFPPAPGAPAAQASAAPFAPASEESSADDLPF